jgi:dipeptidyl aminopeptidase/acylaminoacyl peptidase
MNTPSITRVILLLLVLLSACARQPAPIISPESIGSSSQTFEAAQKKTGLEPSAASAAKAAETGEILLPAEIMPVVNWSAPPDCGAPPCPQLVIAQEGKIARADWSAQGFRAAPAVPTGLPEGVRYVIDTGTPSPDGNWAAYTTLGYETGGPVMLQNTRSGEITNLIEAVIQRQPAGQQPLREDLLWDVIGWFPDNTRLMLGPGDLSMVMIVNRETYAAQILPYPGGGRGGRMFVSLAPDGSRFFFVGEDAQGMQALSTYNLEDNSVVEMQKIPYSAGVVMQPRFSPDGASIAYITQKGQPESGLTWELSLMPAGAGEGGTRALAKGNLAAAVPTWSPDGQYIAFTRDDARPTLLAAPGAVPEPLRGNLWVVSIADGTETQVTSMEGLARSPAWAADGKTLAFVTHDGQVGMASLEQPGQIWQAAGPSNAYPELTNTFFLPGSAEPLP